MAKFYGKIGYALTVEEAPGVWVDRIEERPYTGDVLKKTSKWGAGESLNQNLNITDTISIVGDSFTLENMHMMRYVVWRGANWQINSIDIKRPRLLLSIGGLYNGATD